MSETVRVATFVTLTSAAAVGTVLLTACCSIGLTLALQTALSFILYVIATVGEIGVAVVAAVVSGFTVSLTVILSATASAVTFPPSRIEARLVIAAVVATGSMVTSAVALISLTSIRIDVEFGVAAVTSAAVAVAFASVWAVGVMSLVERETHHVGLKMTSLLQAVRHNKYHVLSLLVHLPFGSREGESDTALLYAVKAGFVECVRVLISAGANPNVQDAYNSTPLISASQLGSAAMLNMLLEAGAIVNFRNESKETALHHAAKSGHEECTRILLAHGADPGVQDSLWRTPLMLTIRHARKPGVIIQMLLDAGSHVNTTGSEHRTALHYASLRGLNVDVLLNNGADCGIRDTEGNTPLHLAALEGSPENVQAMLDVNADSNSANYVRRTPLHLGASRGSVACIELLMLAGADALSADSNGHLPINHAVLSKKEQAVLYFLRRNLFPGATDESTESFTNSLPHINPLEQALEKGYFNLARALILGGCKKDVHHERHLGNRRALDESQEVDLEILKTCFSEPWPLGDMCRCVIRRGLRQPMTDTQRLPLPNQIREFILLQDIVELFVASDDTPMLDFATN